MPLIILSYSCLGMRPQGMPGSQPVNPAASRTHMPSGFSNQQNAGVPSMEKTTMSQQNNGEHNSADMKKPGESETENVVYLNIISFSQVIETISMNVC